VQNTADGSLMRKVLNPLNLFQLPPCGMIPHLSVL